MQSAAQCNTSTSEQEMLTAMVTPSRQIIFVQFNLLYWGSMTTSSLQLTSVYWLLLQTINCTLQFIVDYWFGHHHWKRWPVRTNSFGNLQFSDVFLIPEVAKFFRMAAVVTSCFFLHFLCNNCWFITWTCMSLTVMWSYFFMELHGHLSLCSQQVILNIAELPCNWCHKRFIVDQLSPIIMLIGCGNKLC